MRALVAIRLGPFAGPLASSARALNPPIRGEFGGVAPMTVSASPFSSSRHPLSVSSSRHLIPDLVWFRIARRRGGAS